MTWRGGIPEYVSLSVVLVHNYVTVLAEKESQCCLYWLLCSSNRGKQEAQGREQSGKATCKFGFGLELLASMLALCPKGVWLGWHRSLPSREIYPHIDI